MKKTVTLFYKEWHTDNQIQLRAYDSMEQAEIRAKLMIDQFRYWGAGSIPISISHTKWTKRWGAETIKNIEYSEEEYIQYARENGNI